MNETNNKRFLKRIILFIVAFNTVVLLICGIWFVAELRKPIEYYECNDISEYGNYVGNINNRTPREFIQSFFPEEISDDFQNVIYSYRAENLDTYGFEAYLEFKIPDKTAFDSYVSSIAPAEEWAEFYFDSTFAVHDIANELDITPREISDGGMDYSIEYAKIGRVLISESEQTVIYVAIGVYDGGGVCTSYLSQFFSRFNIDIAQYAQISD